MKLRLTRLVAALVLASAALTASAAPVSPAQTVVTPAGVTWSMGTAFGSWNINDANYAGHGDAYDSGWLVFVNGAGYSPVTVDLTDTTLTGPTMPMSGLDVSVQYYFAPLTAVARILVTLRNPTGAPVSASVYVPTNLGSDSTTIYQTTSSGDSSITTADRWIISSDAYGPSDPVNTSVFYGPGALEVPTGYVTTVHASAGSEGIGATFALDIPAGGTQSLMFFAGLNGITSATNTVAAAQAAAAAFNSSNTLLPEWLAGLTGTQKSQIVNWSLASFTTCAAAGFTGTKLTLCRQICEVPQSPARLNALIKTYLAAFREDPPCAN